jgi:hypothetical protein
VGPGLRDLAGNALSGIVNSQFTTGTANDASPPNLLGSQPVSAGPPVPRNTVLEFRYDERLSPAWLNENSMRVSDNSTGRQLEGVMPRTGA